MYILRWYTSIYVQINKRNLLYDRRLCVPWGGDTQGGIRVERDGQDLDGHRRQILRAPLELRAGNSPVRLYCGIIIIRGGLMFVDLVVTTLTLLDFTFTQIWY